VFVSTHSRRSYFLFRKYEHLGANVICACRLKRDKQLIVDSQYEDGAVILMTRDDTPRLAIAYSDDLESMFEREES
jgi:hypothetical protein